MSSLENVAGLDPEIEAFLGAAAAVGFPPGVRVGTPAGEEYVVSQRALFAGGASTREPVAAVSDELTSSGVPVRVYQPDCAGPRPIIVYFHGGGWVMGNLEMHDATCRLLANQAGAVVVNVAYRLAPEHPFPVPLEDAWEATRWAMSRAPDWGVDPERTFVAGSSAGGNLAAAITIRWRNEGHTPVLAGQILIYPVTDSRMDTPSFHENGEGYALTAEQMSFFWDAYVPDPAGREDPLASPAHVTSVEGLPPAIVITAEFDPLRDEGETYSTRLADAGVPSELIRVPGQIHGFLAAFPKAPLVAETLEQITAWVGRVGRQPTAGTVEHR